MGAENGGCLNDRDYDARRQQGENSELNYIIA
jgi:hypothetical protein